MKKLELKELIKEEIRKVLKENVTIDPALLTALKTALKSRIRYPEDEGAHDDMQMTLARIYKKAGLENPKELAAGTMEAEETMTGPLDAVLELIQGTIESESSYNTKTYEVMGSGPNGITVAYLEKEASTDQGMIRVRENKDVYQYKGSFDQMIKELIDKKVLIKKGTNKYQISNPSVNSTDRIAQYHSDIALMKKAILKNPNFKKK
jgi:hypothetical protein